MSLRKNIFLLLFSISLVPLSILTLFLESNSEKNIKESIVNHHVKIAREKSQAIASIIQERIEETNTLALDDSIITWLKKKKITLQA